MADNFSDFLIRALLQAKQQPFLNHRSDLPSTLESISLPKLFTLISLGSKTAPLIRNPSQESETDGGLLFLRNVMSRKLKPSAATGSRSENSHAERLLEQGAKRHGVTLKPGEAKKIIQLLETGEFLNDLHSSTATVLSCISGMPISILKDIPRAFEPKLMAALFMDIASITTLLTSPFLVERLIRDLLDGKLDNPPAILTNTVKVLYGNATVAQGMQTIQQLYSPENESVRLATILFARTHHIDLEEHHIDTLRNSVFNPDDPQLAPALSLAFEVFYQKYNTKFPFWL